MSNDGSVLFVATPDENSLETEETNVMSAEREITVAVPARLKNMIQQMVDNYGDSEISATVLPIEGTDDEALGYLGLLLSGDQLPDVILSADANIVKLVESDSSAFLRYQDYGELSDYSNFKIGNLYQSDNSVYGIPFDGMPMAFYYNKDLLNKIGVEIKNGITWDEFITIGKQFRAKFKKPMLPYPDNETVFAMLKSYGMSFYDEDKNISLDGCEQVLEFFNTMQHEGLFSDEDVSLTKEVEQLFSGDIGGIIASPSIIKSIQEKCANSEYQNWGVIELPKSDIFRYNVNAESSCSWLVKRSRDEESNNEIIAWLESAILANMMQYVGSEKLIPVKESMITDCENLPQEEYFDKNVIYYLATIGRDIPIVIRGKKIIEFSGMLYEKAKGILSGELSVAEALEQLDDEMKDDSDGGSSGSGSDPEPMGGVGDGQNYNGGSISEDIETDPEYARKSFTLPCGGEVSLNLATGKSKFVFSDCITEDSPIGISVAHLFDKENNASGYGTNFGLNLDESLTVNDDGNYVYTDGLGRTHTCETEYYVIEDNGEKKDVQKSVIEVKADGKLEYLGKEVKTEACLESGLTFGGELKGAFINLKYFEQRSDEIKQLEEQKESYEKVFKDYIIANSSLETKITSTSYFENVARFSNFISNADHNTQLMLTKSDRLSGRSLFIEIENINEQLLELEKKTDDDSKKKKTRLNKQKNFILEQLSAITTKSSENVEMLKKYFVVYRKVLSDLEKYKTEQAVNYASDGKIVKAFRSDGKLVAIIDAYENTITFEYNDKGKLTGIYSGDKKEIKIDYDSKNTYPVKIADGRGRKIAYTYDGSLLKTITYPDETKLTFEYSSTDGITAIVNSVGKKTNFVYTNGKLTSVKNYAVQGSTETLLTEYTIAYATNKTTITAKNGEEIYDYNNGKLCGYTEVFDGKVIQAEKYSYTPNETKHIERAVKKTLNKSALSSFTYTRGEAVDIVLNKFNLPVKKTITGLDENAGIVAKVETQYEYNADNLCVKTEVKSYKANTATPFITTTSKTDYNPQGKVVRTESYVVEDKAEKGKNTVEYFYDDKGREIKRLAYNSLDTGSKFSEEHTYDDIGRELSSTTETGEVTSYEYYDDTASLRSVKYPNGAVIAYGKDITDNVTAVTQSTEDGEENSTLRRYFDNGLTKKVESGNTKIEYEYDEKDRVTQIKLNGDTKATIAYAEDVTASDGTSTDETTVTNANGETIKTTTDKAGNVRSVKFNNNEQWNATYTKNGEVKALEDKITGKIEKNYFDEYGRKFAYIIKNGVKIPYKEEYSYDNYGNPLQATFGDRAYAYTYNNDSAKTLKGVSTGGVSFERKTDKAGRNAGKVITQGSTEIAKESIRYLKFGDRATNLPFAVDFKDGRITYKYDKVGNIKEIRKNGEIIAKYKYDTLGRLVREDNKSFNNTVTYTYDNCGNILEKRTYAYTLVDDIEEKEHTTVSYKYDGDKLLKYGTEACAYDVLGNPTTYRGKTATWEKGRLKTYNGVTLGYDGRGTRISSGSLTFEYSSDGKLLKRSDGLEFIYDLQGLAGVVDNSGSTAKTYFYRKDAQGNIVALLDENGAVVVKYVYNAWGEHKVLNPDGTENTSASFIGNVNPFRYRGYYYDKALKLYYLVTRYYDPVVGRFISQDSFDYADPDTINGLNLYAYCANNPVMNVDPTGTWSWRGFWNVLAAVAIVAAVTALTVVTAGAATVAIAGALGASALTIAGATATVITTAATFGLIGGISEIVTQSIDKGIDNINLGSVAIQSFASAVDGALYAGSLFGGASGKLLLGGLRIATAMASAHLYGLSEGYDQNQIADRVNSAMLGAFVGSALPFIKSPAANIASFIAQPILSGRNKIGITILKEVWKRIISPIVGKIKSYF